jgi:poly-beta-1,6 N-acetyl-D-glucosamine synthase
MVTRYVRTALLLFFSGMVVAGFSLLIVGGLRIFESRFGTQQFLTGVSVFFAIFFAAVGLRYVVLICFSFMEHLDSLLFDKKNPIDDRKRALPFVSIVVPAYNEEMLIDASLNSLLELDYPGYEILVVDDGSTDGTYARAMELARASTRVPVRVIRKLNGGKADALNVGIAHARGQFVLNMDSDTVLDKNALRACVRHFSDPKVAAVAGNIKVFNRENILTRIQAIEYIQGLAITRKAQSHARICNIIPGPLGMFRKDALQQVGGYDEDTFAEDCDVTLKLLMRGWHVVYEANAVAWVETPSRSNDLIKQRYRWCRGILQAIRKHKNALWHPEKGGINFLILWYMLFENVIWPLVSVAATLVFVYIGLSHGMVMPMLLFWWIQLTLLDAAVAMYCVTVEKEDISLVGYTPLFRVFYILFIDVIKVIANFEELVGIKMTWGKLQREGKL